MKKMTIYWTEGIEFQYAKLSFFVEKPPVAILLIEWFRASKKLIPAILNAIVSRIVRPK